MLGSPILYLKAMRILMFQLSGFYCKCRRETQVSKQIKDQAKQLLRDLGPRGLALRFFFCVCDVCYFFFCVCVVVFRLKGDVFSFCVVCVCLFFFFFFFGGGVEFGVLGLSVLGA